MFLEEFKSKIEQECKLKGLMFNVHQGDEGGHWYSIKLKTGLLEIYIASDGEIGINKPSIEDMISFGGCDEEYDNFREAFKRVVLLIRGVRSV